jgi:hypothetical protein
LKRLSRNTSRQFDPSFPTQINSCFRGWESLNSISESLARLSSFQKKILLAPRLVQGAQRIAWIVAASFVRISPYWLGKFESHVRRAEERWHNVNIADAGPTVSDEK